jgi:hypothetical protein
MDGSSVKYDNHILQVFRGLSIAAGRNHVECAVNGGNSHADPGAAVNE